MFRPNTTCTISLVSGKTDVYGQPLPGIKVNERCAVVFLNIQSVKSAVRADAAPSNGNAREFEADANILLTKQTQANIDDVLTVQGTSLRIFSKRARYDVNGVLDHFEVTAKIWK